MDQLFEDQSDSSTLKQDSLVSPIPSARTQSIPARATRFIHLLVFWSLVCPPSNGNLNQRRPRNAQHKFLNSLSLLADFDKGGPTVTAIAIEDVRGVPLYWVAANSGVETKVIQHFAAILTLLGRTHAIPDHEVALIEQEISEMSVSFAGRTAKKYHSKLVRHIQSIKRKMKAEPHAVDELLMSVLTTWTSILDQHTPDNMMAICGKARQFCKSPDFRRLKTAHRPENLHHPWTYDWFHIHHYIERLGAWHKAARILVSVAKRDPALVSYFQIQPVTAPGVLSIPRTSYSLEDIVLSIWPDLPPSEVVRKFQSMRKPTTDELSKMFADRLNNALTDAKAHAECILAEHFYTQNLRFFRGDRYIGCSKPSCYCCDRYLRAHPGQFAMRPSHGNTYSNWAFPVTELTEDNVRGQHTLDILQSLSETLERGIKLQYEVGKAWTGKCPDSLTGFSSTLASSLSMMMKH